MPDLSGRPIDLARLVVRGRWVVAGFWAAAAVALLPQARHAARRLQVGARIETSESAAVERLLAGSLASSYARFAVLVIRGIPSPDTPAGAAALDRLLRPVARASG